MQEERQTQRRREFNQLALEVLELHLAWAELEPVIVQAELTNRNHRSRTVAPIPTNQACARRCEQPIDVGVRARTVFRLELSAARRVHADGTVQTRRAFWTISAKLQRVLRFQEADGGDDDARDASFTCSTEHCGQVRCVSRLLAILALKHGVQEVRADVYERRVSDG